MLLPGPLGHNQPRTGRPRSTGLCSLRCCAPLVAGSGAGERSWTMHAAHGYVPLGFRMVAPPVVLVFKTCSLEIYSANRPYLSCNLAVLGVPVLYVNVCLKMGYIIREYHHKLGLLTRWFVHFWPIDSSASPWESTCSLSSWSFKQIQTCVSGVRHFPEKCHANI